jgi:hypothetical protein
VPKVPPANRVPLVAAVSKTVSVIFSIPQGRTLQAALTPRHSDTNERRARVGGIRSKTIDCWLTPRPQPPMTRFPRGTPSSLRNKQ